MKLAALRSAAEQTCASVASYASSAFATKACTGKANNGIEVSKGKKAKAKLVKKYIHLAIVLQLLPLLALLVKAVSWAASANFISKGYTVYRKS